MSQVLIRVRKAVFFVLSIALLLPFFGNTTIRAAEYTVTYHVREYGGAWSVYTTTSTINSGEIVLPAEPDMELQNYGDYKSFLGWSTELDPHEDAELVDLDAPISSSIDLYAVMSTDYKIEYRYAPDGELILYKLVRPGMNYPVPSEKELETANFTIADDKYFEDTWQDKDGTPINFSADKVNGNAVLVPILSEAVWISFDLQGGSVGGNSIDPLKVKKGATYLDVIIPNIFDVTKTGASPSHWSLNGSGSQVEDDYIFNADTELFAVFIPEDGVPYQIVYWVEKPNLGVNFSPRPGNPAHYDFGYSVTVGGFGNPGETIGGPGSGADIIISSIPSYNYFGVEDPMRWAQWQATELTTIEADASTIVNVYCTLRVYRIIFEITDVNDPESGLPVGRYMEFDRNGDGIKEIYNQSTPYSFDFKFGDKISSKWPHPVNGAVFHHENDDEYSHWEHPSLAVISGVWQTPRADITGAMMPASPNASGYVVTLAWTAATAKIGMLYWAELLPGQLEDDSVVKREYDGQWWGLLSDYSAEIPDNAPDIASKAIPGFEAGVQGDFSDTPEGEGYSTPLNEQSAWHNYVNHYYIRVKSNLYFNMEGHGSPHLEEAGIPYSNSIAPLNLPGFESVAYGTSLSNFNVSVDDVTGWHFLGWYVDAAGTLPFDFNTTMPANDLTLFAKWESTDLTVTFMDSDGLTILGVQGVQMYGKVKFTNLTLGGIRYVVNEYNDPNKGALIGWQYIPASSDTRVTFDPSTTLYKNETLYALWQSTGLSVMYHDDDGSVLLEDKGDNNLGYNLGVITSVKSGEGVSCVATSVFVGWRLDGTGAVYQEDDNLTVIGNMHMYPYCANEDADLSDLKYMESEGYVVQYVDGYGTVILSYVAMGNDYVPKPSDSDLVSAKFVYPADKVFDGTWKYRESQEVVDYVNDTVSGHVVIEPVLYDAASIFFTTLSTPAQSIKVKLGSTYSSLELPDINSFERTGYHVLGWSTNPDPDTPDLLDPEATVDQSAVNLYLKWAGDTDIAYHITYWIEKPNLGANFIPVPGNINHYDVGYIDPTVYYATAGFSVGGPGSAADIIINSLPVYTTFDMDDPMHWAVWQATMPATIAGDGSTVVNVYATLKKYTLTFDLGDDSRTMTVNGVTYGANEPAGNYTLEIKYGLSLRENWPHPLVGTTFSGPDTENFITWQSTGGYGANMKIAQSIADLDIMPIDWYSDGYTLTLQTNANAYQGLIYWFEKLPEQNCEEDGLICKTINHLISGEPTTYVYDPFYTGISTNVGIYQKEIYGFTPVGSRTSDSGCEVDATDSLPDRCSSLYYDRLRANFSYDLRGFAASLTLQMALEDEPRNLGELTATKTLMYGQTLKNLGVDLPDIVNQRGEVIYRFIHWSSTSELAYPFDFDQTMPINDIVIYAAYESTDHIVTFRDSDGTPLASDGSDTQGVKDGGTVRFDGLTIGGTLYIPEGTFHPTKGLFLGWQIKEEGTGNLVDFHSSTPIYSDTILYAKWQSTGLHVVYHNADYSVLYTDAAESGLGYMVGTQVAVKGNDYPDLAELNIPANASFVGWRINGTGLIYTEDSLLTMDGIIHLYPLFRYNDYPITLNPVTFYSNTGKDGEEVSGDLDGDGIEDLSYPVVNGNNYYLPEAALVPSFKKNGKVLIGWSDKADVNEEGALYYPAGTEIISSGAQEFYAVYADALSVTYHDNVEDKEIAVPLDEVEYVAGQTVYVKFNIASTYTDSGRTYAFKGWSLDSEAIDATYTETGLLYFEISDNTDLYAIWQESFTLTYNGNGYTGKIPEDDNPYFLNDEVEVSFDINDSYTDLETGKHYVFVGWDEDPNAEDPTYKAGENESFEIDHDTILYAIWQEVFTVTYNGNGYTGWVPIPVDMNLYEPQEEVKVKFGLLDRYTNHEGQRFRFLGWSEDAGASEPEFIKDELEAFNITKDTILYAIWQPLYRVTYDNNGYDVQASDENEYDPGDEVDVIFPEAPDYEDDDYTYTFVGWDEDPDAIDPTYTPDGNTDFEIDKDTTLYAIYKVHPKHPVGAIRNPQITEEEEPEVPVVYTPQPVIAAPPTGVDNPITMLLASMLISALAFVIAIRRKEEETD
jgi:uncharacterized repeat protein (TIGR02543 family)